MEEWIMRKRNRATETKLKGKGNKLREILSLRWREEEGKQKKNERGR